MKWGSLQFLLDWAVEISRFSVWNFNWNSPRSQISEPQQNPRCLLCTLTMWILYTCNIMFSQPDLISTVLTCRTLSSTQDPQNPMSHSWCAVIWWIRWISKLEDHPGFPWIMHIYSNLPGYQQKDESLVTQRSIIHLHSLSVFFCSLAVCHGEKTCTTLVNHWGLNVAV